MLRDGHLLLMRDVTHFMPTAGHMENTACCFLAGAYHVYRAVAWQCIDQIHYNTSKILEDSSVACAIGKFLD
jgi:hypothetical protein